MESSKFENASQEQKEGVLFGQVERSTIWCLESPGPEVPLFPDSVYILLGGTGEYSIHRKGKEIGSGNVDGSSTLVFVLAEAELSLQKGGGKLEPSLLFGFRKQELIASLSPRKEGLSGEVSAALFEGKRIDLVQRCDLVPSTLSRLTFEFRHIKSSDPAADLWLESRVREVMALTFFHSKPGLSEQPAQRSDAIEMVKNQLRLHYKTPPTLEKLAAETGLSPTYLSRKFSAETGKTIKGYLRQVRIKKATELLQRGDFNVSEAAGEVGYRSFSHFSKAFQEETGRSPSRFRS